jgi:gluconolactonase
MVIEELLSLKIGKNELFFTDPPYGFKNGDNDELKELQFNGVFRLSPNGELKLLIKNLLRPNGIAISNDEKTLYVANSDSKNPIIMKYQITDYGVENAKIFFDGSVLFKNTSIRYYFCNWSWWSFVD